jgi:hypothetical protein
MVVATEKEELLFGDDERDIFIVIEKFVLFIPGKILQYNQFKTVTLFKSDTLIFVVDIFEKAFGKLIFLQPCSDCGIVQAGKNHLLFIRMYVDFVLKIEPVREKIHDAALLQV